MDFRELISVASTKQRVKEKELSQSRKGSTMSLVKNNGQKQIVDEAKRKKLEAIRARVEAQMKADENNKEQESKGKEEIMDFTKTGLSDNDIRRKALSTAELAKRKKEFEEKLKRLKENPIGSEPIGNSKLNVSSKTKSPPALKNVKSKEICALSDSDDEEYQNRIEQSDLLNGKSTHKSYQFKSDAASYSLKNKSDTKDKNRDRKKDKSKNHSKDKSKHSDKKSKHCKPAAPAEWISVKSNPLPPVKKLKKPRPAGPPPMSFTELLSVAQENKLKPDLKLTQEKKKEKSRKIIEPNRPMTQEEKERFERMNTPEYQHWLKHGGPKPGSVSDKKSDLLKASTQKPTNGVNNKEIIARNESKSERMHPNKTSNLTKISSSSSLPAKSDKMGNMGMPGRHSQMPHKTIKPTSAATDNNKKSKQEDATNPFDRIYNQIKRKPKTDLKRKHVIESDDEYDENMDDFIEEDDMDDFIDDTEAQDYSKYIKDIFGYDKRRYCDEDDDVSDMEVGFAEVMKEEIHSAKVGRMEDLEDMRMEQEELERKKLLKKKKMKIH